MDDLRGLTAEAVPTPSVEGGAGPRLETRRLDGPVDLAVLARRTTTDLVWFDSALPEGAPPSAGLRAAWSVLALTDGPFAARFRHQDRVARLDVSPAAGSWFGSSRVEDRAAFAVLDDLLQRTPTLDAPVDGCAFALGWVGFLGYELGREVDGPDRTADGHADADLRFVDRAVLVRGGRSRLGADPRGRRRAGRVRGEPRLVGRAVRRGPGRPGGWPLRSRTTTWRTGPRASRTVVGSPTGPSWRRVVASTARPTSVRWTRAVTRSARATRSRCA
ncbi:hypothetical protein [Curtobacterium sp. MCJR17_043]|uniref:hypothetical protein n=1 Tax=Curtobacterium sp. MCJR17_043 TaxID=2175660 RepID=UPI0024DF934A|nr:hypothetical protein [Curtobacterium sp. MCJR17_043]WIB36859.1 hypothetical protein DEJ15_07670 [Curtobacterium sp. MCJR17_043]